MWLNSTIVYDPVNRTFEIPVIRGIPVKNVRSDCVLAVPPPLLLLLTCAMPQMWGHRAVVLQNAQQRGERPMPRRHAAAELGHTDEMLVVGGCTIDSTFPELPTLKFDVLASAENAFVFGDGMVWRTALSAPAAGL